MSRSVKKADYGLFPQSIHSVCHDTKPVGSSIRLAGFSFGATISLSFVNRTLNSFTSPGSCLGAAMPALALQCENQIPSGFQ